MWSRYQLGKTVLKTKTPITLLQSEKAQVEVDSNALAVQIEFGGQKKGYVFHGRGKLILDTIIETDEGAIGKPIEREINEPFLMLSENKEIEQHIIVADRKNLESMGYQSDQEFLVKAEELLHKFAGKELLGRNCYCCCGSGFIFAFPNKTGKLDVLIANGPRLVFKSTDKVFITNNDKVVLKTPHETVVSNNRKSVVIKKKRF
jgi:hypothetical protein